MGYFNFCLFYCNPYPYRISTSIYQSIYLSNLSSIFLLLLSFFHSSLSHILRADKPVPLVQLLWQRHCCQPHIPMCFTTLPNLPEIMWGLINSSNKWVMINRHPFWKIVVLSSLCDFFSHHNAWGDNKTEVISITQS